MIDERIEDEEIEEIFRDEAKPTLSDDEKAKLVIRAYDKAIEEYSDAVRAMGAFVGVLERIKGVQAQLGDDLYSWLCYNIGKATEGLSLGPLFQIFDPDDFFYEFRVNEDSNEDVEKEDGQKWPTIDEVRSSKRLLEKLEREVPDIRHVIDIIAKEKDEGNNA